MSSRYLSAIIPHSPRMDVVNGALLERDQAEWSSSLGRPQARWGGGFRRHGEKYRRRRWKNLGQTNRPGKDVRLRYLIHVFQTHGEEVHLYLIAGSCRHCSLVSLLEAGEFGTRMGICPHSGRSKQVKSELINSHPGDFDECEACKKVYPEMFTWFSFRQQSFVFERTPAARNLYLLSAVVRRRGGGKRLMPEGKTCSAIAINERIILFPTFAS